MSCPAHHLTRKHRPGRSRVAALGATLVLVLGLFTGCSGEASDTSSDRPPGTSAPQGISLRANPVATTSQIAHVYGRLPRSKRAAVRRKVVAVVDRWWDAAYLGGSYPRSGFEDPFPGFTRGAEARARRDKHLMTNRDISEDIDSVTARHRRVVLDVLAVGRTPRSVTARFKLRFRVTSGETSEQVVLSGRLFLTQREGAWRVFGYDVAKGNRTKGGRA